MEEEEREGNQWSVKRPYARKKQEEKNKKAGEIERENHRKEEIVGVMKRDAITRRDSIIR